MGLHFIWIPSNTCASPDDENGEENKQEDLSDVLIATRISLDPCHEPLERAYQDDHDYYPILEWVITFAPTVLFNKHVFTYNYAQLMKTS